MPAEEILTHRVVWSFVFMSLLVAFQRRGTDIRRAFANGRTLLIFALSGLLISANWFIFIWSVNNGHVIETSLGYYLTPLLNVLIGVLFLGEKPNVGQWLAVALAGAGVLFVALDYGRVPWISLSLALSFGFYGLVKKKASYDASIGMLGETMIVLPIAASYMVFLGASGGSTAWTLPASKLALLLLSGVATAFPLLWFAKAAAKLPLSMLGFIQYIGPSITLLLSVFVFRESFSPVLLGSFTLIWSALIVYTLSSMRTALIRRRSAGESL
jgi:chloramphenicol-sensitive protein RarD